MNLKAKYKPESIRKLKKTQKDGRKCKALNEQRLEELFLNYRNTRM